MELCIAARVTTSTHVCALRYTHVCALRYTQCHIHMYTAVPSVLTHCPPAQLMLLAPSFRWASTWLVIRLELSYGSKARAVSSHMARAVVDNTVSPREKLQVGHLIKTSITSRLCSKTNYEQPSARERARQRPWLLTPGCTKDSPE